MALKDPFRYFRIEARELLEGLQRGVAGLAGAGYDPERISSLLRLAHTLKGAARVVRLPAVSDLAHRLEDILAPCRESAVSPTRDQFGELKQLLETIDRRLAAIEHPPAAEAPATSVSIPV